VVLASAIADYVVRLNSDGVATPQGSMAEVLKQEPSFLKEIREAKDENLAGQDEKTVPEREGKLIVAEEIATGRVRWPAMKLYISNFGGPFLWSSVLAFCAIAAFLNVVHVWYLGLWARQSEEKSPGELSSTR
jgi:hypothetical protein